MKSVILAFAAAGLLQAQPAISTVLNGASYRAVLSPGCWVVIFGTNLASAPVTAPAGSLQTTLGGVSVSFGGVPAQLLYVSPTQINALIPAEVVIPQNTVVPVAVTAPAGKVSYEVRLTRNAPGLFTQNGTGTGGVLAFDANFGPVNTVAAQNTIILYAAGLGPLSADGRVADPIDVYIGERKAQVLYAGLAPGFPGVYQLNVTVPTPATDRIYIDQGEWRSNIASVGIRGGSNVSNVTASIDGLNPSSDPGYPTTPQRPCMGDMDVGPCGPAPFSESLPLMLHAGTFRLSLDIAASAATFDIAAVGEAGGVLITINPATNTYAATITTIGSDAFRVFDFSASIAPLWDFASCDWRTAVCLQFPHNVIPATRILPFTAKAIQMLPAGSATAGTLNALLQSSGTISGLHFAVDDQNNSMLSKFGGFVQVPYGPFPTGTSTFKIYVDGKLVASKDLPYLIYNRAQVEYAPELLCE